MPVLAGRTARLGRRPFERIATDAQTSDSANIGATETVVQSVTASLVSGRTYRVRWFSGVNTDTNNAQYNAILREDNLAGTARDVHRKRIEVLGSSIGWWSTLEVHHTAGSTGNKTFVVTLQRVSGSGNVWREAGTNHPSRFYVDYVEG